MLMIDPAIKPVDDNLLLAQINGELDSLADKHVFIEFGEAFTDDELVIEGVTHTIYDASNDAFDDTACI